MSLGHDDTQGSKKTNFNWQYRMLKALGLIITAVGGTPSGTPTPTVPVASEATVDGSTPVSKGITLWFRGTGGSLDGVSVPDNGIFSFNPNSVSSTVSPIAYTVPTAGEARIIITYTA